MSTALVAEDGEANNKVPAHKKLAMKKEAVNQSIYKIHIKYLSLELEEKGGQLGRFRVGLLAGGKGMKYFDEMMVQMMALQDVGWIEDKGKGKTEWAWAESSR